MRPADKAWLALGAGVFAYELLAPPDELLSEGMDRYRRSQPLLAWGGVTVTALHLLRLIPEWMDPYTFIATLRRSRVVPGPIE